MRCGVVQVAGWLPSCAVGFVGVRGVEGSRGHDTSGSVGRQCWRLTATSKVERSGSGSFVLVASACTSKKPTLKEGAKILVIQNDNDNDNDNDNRVFWWFFFFFFFFFSCIQHKSLHWSMWTCFPWLTDPPELEVNFRC